MAARRTRADPLVRAWAEVRDPERGGFEDAWVGLEPTFQSPRGIALAEKHADDDKRYFEHRYTQGKLEQVARRIARKFEKHRAREPRPAWCFFDRVERGTKRDKWKTRRQELSFRFRSRGLDDFEVKFGLDPSTFEYGIKPVPVAWLYDPRFVEFLEQLVFAVPRKEGLAVSALEGGGQFHLSAKTLLSGSLLADAIASALDHPELATWTLDWPNRDDRALRATSARRAAFERELARYWRGEFHPRARGVLRAGEVLFGDAWGDPGAGAPAHAGGARRASRSRRPGPERRDRALDEFQQNFAFGRAVARLAQPVHAGYWHLARPDDDGYRPEQIGRYGELNLLRLQIAGELHVKDFAVLAPERVPAADAPLAPAMLAPEASLELRRHMSRVDARDMVEAVLLEVHHLRALARRPRVSVARSLLQDQLLADAERTLARHGGAARLDALRRRARAANLAESGGRLRSAAVEPETLFFAAWQALPRGERAALAREVIGRFAALVHEAAAEDPRRPRGDPMDAHRHRVHPLLFEALARTRLRPRDPVARELAAWRAQRERLFARRPPFSLTGVAPPWSAR